VSALFRSMRRYGEKYADQWFILSARHGLLRPEQVVVPYEQTLKAMSKQERLLWGEKVQKQLLKRLPNRASVIVLAGERYREHICPFLVDHGYQVSVPMAGKKLGMQLRWLKEHAK
jgi:cytoplasmic iron level regulating protein YaaA (DUF328/UPF0246 family)